MPEYTITVAGVERLDGEAPYVYVVHAPDQLAAELIATTEHDRYEREDVGIDLTGGDAVYDGPTVDPEKSYEGSPFPTWGIKAELYAPGS